MDNQLIAKAEIAKHESSQLHHANRLLLNRFQSSNLLPAAIYEPHPPRKRLGDYSVTIAVIIITLHNAMALIRIIQPWIYCSHGEPHPADEHIATTRGR